MMAMVDDMSDIRMIKNKIHELASQVYILATGLQNAAPPGAPGKSVQYLLETAAHLEEMSHRIESVLLEDFSQPNSS